MTAASPVAIVTAASKGMGAAIARELAGRGYRLALMARSEGINALASELGGVALQGSVIELKDLERLVALAQERYGRVDAVVNDEVGLRYAFQQMEGLEVGGTIETGELFAMMMPKDSPLLEEVNQAISDMKTDGTMAQLYEKWFGVAPPRTA